MKFSPTITLAVVLAAGMTAAAVAQTAPVTSDSKSTVTQPKAGSIQGQQGLNDSKATLNDKKSASTVEMKTTAPMAKSAGMKAVQPRVKRTAHLRSTPRRMAQMKAAQTMPGRTAHLHRSAAQAQNLASDQIKAAQQQLQAAGLYNGPTDGMMDPDTRAALARYQQQNGLRRTETLDPQTLARLNTNQTSGVGSSTPGPSTTVAPSGNQGTPAPAGAGGNNTGQPITR